THPRLDHHVTELARHIGVGSIGPVCRVQLIAEGLAPITRRILAYHGRWRTATLRNDIEDHLLDGVGFGEHTTILHKRGQSSCFDNIPMTAFCGADTFEPAVFPQLGNLFFHCPWSYTQPERDFTCG